jgi:hypothetical protein
MLRWLAVISSKVRSSLRIPALHKQPTIERESMNTITIGSVSYNELEVKHYIDNSNKKSEALSDVRYKVRDFFSEREWEDSKTTVTRSEINELFSTIGVDHLRGKYKATLTITAYINDYPAQDKDDAINCLEDDIEVNVGSSATITVDRIEVDDIEEEE